MTTWTTWLVAGGDAARRLVADRSGTPAHERVFGAVEGALVAAHANLGGLRRVLLVVLLALSLAAVAGCHALGARLAGPAGALACGGLAAVLPIAVTLSAEARPYAPAWSFGLLAAAAAVSARRAIAAPASAVLLGLSIGCRIEMLAFAPIVLFLLVRRGLEQKGGVRVSARGIVGWLAAVAAATVLAAPWLVTQLLGNLRVIVTVRVFSHGRDVPWARNDLVDLAWGEGLVGAGVLAMVGVLGAGRESRLPAALVGGWLLVLLASIPLGTAYGLRHQGPTLLALVVLAPLGLRLFEHRLRPAARLGLAGLVLALPALQSVRDVASLRARRPNADPLSWIAQHVPAESTLYWPSFELAAPLPTRESGDRLWSEVADPGAWRRKVERAVADHGLDVQRVPRALSATHVMQDQGIRRRWFLLAGAAGDGPRHDVVPWSDMSPFDVPSRDLPRRLAETGGALLWRGPPIEELEPAVEADDAAGLRLYLARPAPSDPASRGTEIASSRAAGSDG